MAASLSPEMIASIAGGYNGDPFAVLGPHMTTVDAGPAVVIRTFLPWAEHVQAALDDGTLHDMGRIHPDGLFEAAIQVDNLPGYTLRATNRQGYATDLHDPYSFGPLLSEFDLHLLSEGSHYRTYEKLGAHIRDVGGTRGVHFAVWAPNARRVSVIGNFNNWDGRIHPMRFHPAPGIWEIFISGLGAGEAYKYQIMTGVAEGQRAEMLIEKADPYGFYAEYRPNTSSIVADIDHYEWNDAQWLAERSSRQAFSSPLSIYEVHLGSWKRVPGGGRPTTADRSVTEHGGWLDYRQLAHELVDYVKYMGFTHIELMPVSEHPLDGSWGYQTVGYYAVTSRYGTPEDFQYFVDYCHQNGIGVLLDWVPAHFPRDAHGLGLFDGTHLYEHADPRVGAHPDWGTLIFNYGRLEVRNFLLSNALFWLDKYHIDGLRVDAVASMLYLNFSRPEGSWLPNRYGGTENLEAIDFLKRFNELTHLEHPNVLTIAEDSTDWPMVTRPTFLGGLGFDLKWNMGWMNDMLEYMGYDPIYRRYHHNKITFSLMYAFNENFLLPLSHDEVVHLKKSLLSKMPGDSWRQFAGVRALIAYQFTHPGKKLLFMGAELGQRSEWTEQTSLDWHELAHESHRGIHNFVRDLVNLYRSEPALYRIDNSWDGFQWLAANDNENSVIAFVRRSAPTVDGQQSTVDVQSLATTTGNRPPSTVRDEIVVICNFTPVVRQNYRVPAPHAGFYREILNSDSAIYWGSNVGNAGGVWATEEQWSESGYALNLTVPPLGVLLLKAELRPAKPKTSNASESDTKIPDAEPSASGVRPVNPG